MSGALITRPLNPPIRRTMVLLKHRDKRDDPALRVVHQGLMSLKRDMPAA